jgi:hypothetical protein
MKPAEHVTARAVLGAIGAGAVVGAANSYRDTALPGWLHFYSHHRAHSDRRPPTGHPTDQPPWTSRLADVREFSDSSPRWGRRRRTSGADSAPERQERGPAQTGNAHAAFPFSERREETRGPDRTVDR